MDSALTRKVGGWPAWVWLAGVAVFAAIVITLASLQSGDDAGDRTVLNRIKKAPTCAAALAEFNTAKRNADDVGPAYTPERRDAMAYMTAALDRMNDLDCDQVDPATSERVRENR